MTLIVGIRCAEDAVVLASESAATFGYLGQMTVRQQMAKIEIVGDQVLLGVSGPVGLGQRFQGELAKKWGERLSALSGVLGDQLCVEEGVPAAYR